MNRRTLSGVALAVAIALGAWILAPVLLWRTPVIPEHTPLDGFTRARGVVHIHSTLSDGSGTPDEVVAAAVESGLDFLVLTDHNSFEAKPVEGYGETAVLTIVGSEISNHEGHLIALGLPAPSHQFSGDGLDALRDVTSLGGTTFAAHPDSPRPDLQWAGWDLPGGWGLEVVNGDSQWRAAGWLRAAGATLRYPFRPVSALLGLTQRPAILERWDGLLAEREVSAIAGADAHGAYRPSTLSLPLPSYEAVFATVQNYVLLDGPLTGRPAQDIEAVATALARGRSYIGVGGLADPSGFSFVAERDGQQWQMGDRVPAGAPVRIRVAGAIPADSEIRLLRDGVELLRSAPPLETQTDTQGVYRAELILRGWDMPWVLSNPFYLFDTDTHTARAAASALPQPPRAAPDTWLDRFAGRSTFEVIGDDTTPITGPTVTPTGGLAGSGAGYLAFKLGAPDEEHPSPFASLGSYTPRDFSGRTGLTLWARGNDTHRFWLQVRDQNPTGYDGVENWVTSIKVTPDWQPITVPFETLSSTDPGTDGRLDLDEVVGIVLLADLGTHRPGASVELWVDDLGIY